MKTVIQILLALVFLLCACAPSENTVNTAIAQTQAAIPTDTPIPTATPIPFSAFDLEDLLIQQNDLPAGYSGAQVGNTAPEMFGGIPKADYIIYQQFQKNGESAGGVTVFLYESIQSVDKAYQVIAVGMGNTEPVAGDWEKGELVIFSISAINFTAIDVLYADCHSAVHIRLSDIDNKQHVINYAKRLNERLSPLVCR